MLATLCVCVCVCVCVLQQASVFCVTAISVFVVTSGIRFHARNVVCGCVCACIKHPHSVLMNISFTIGHRFLCVLQLASAFSAQEHKLY
jgi:hypothetical protein